MAKTLGDITGALTEKVLAPAKAEAAQLLEESRNQAKAIVAAAEAEAARIKAEAGQEAERLKRQMEVDLDTAARNFLLMVEEKLERAVVEPVIEENLKPLLTDREFLARMIEELVTAFARFGGHEHHIEVLLPLSRQEELDAWFRKRFQAKVAKPLHIAFTDTVSFGFKIGIAGSGQHFNFSGGLVQVFAEFCSPRFRKHFFSRKET